MPAVSLVIDLYGIFQKSKRGTLMPFQTQYNAKRMSATDAAGLIQNGDTIVVGTAAGEPPSLLAALSDRRHELQDVRISQILALKKYGYFDPTTTANIRHAAYFLGGASRAGAQEGWNDFVPCNFSDIPEMIRRKQTPAQAVFCMASPMDEDGNFALGLSPDYCMAGAIVARAIVLEVNPHVPRTFGNCKIHISQVTAFTESSDPIAEVGAPKIGPVQEAIGKYVADLIPNGSTLQIGYGGIPDAVVRQLTNKVDLGIHTEMLGDGILSLIEAGVVNNTRKNINKGKVLATFALGSKKLYNFMHQNPMIEMHPADVTNDPYLAGQNDNLHAINATLQVDFLGQCGSESLGYSPFSGTGGQSDFVRSANRSNGGKAFIVLPSTAKDDTISRIVPVLSSGTFVTTSKNDVNYVVTEFGVAQLRGKSAKQRAEALIAIAHPNFRVELHEQAKKMRLL
jgi:acyl-CoA hydrolase